MEISRLQSWELNWPLCRAPTRVRQYCASLGDINVRVLAGHIVSLRITAQMPSKSLEKTLHYFISGFISVVKDRWIITGNGGWLKTRGDQLLYPLKEGNNFLCTNLLMVDTWLFIGNMCIGIVYWYSEVNVACARIFAQVINQNVNASSCICFFKQIKK